MVASLTAFDSGQEKMREIGSLASLTALYLSRNIQDLIFPH
jgi:hypothetical protein